MTTKRTEIPSPAVRKYFIGDSTYIVKAAVKDNVTEDAVVKIRRLILNDVKRER